MTPKKKTDRRRIPRRSVETIEASTMIAPEKLAEYRTRIEQLYRERRVALFFPESFAGTRHEAQAALRELVQAGDLAEDIHVRCAFGHDLWRGGREAFERNHPERRRDCPMANCETEDLDEDDRDDPDYQPTVAVRYALTDAAREHIDGPPAEVTPEKVCEYRGLAHANSRASWARPMLELCATVENLNRLLSPPPQVTFAEEDEG